MINDWTEYHIEDFGTISTGTTPSTRKPEYYGGAYKFISPADLDNGKYVRTAHKFITDEGLSVSRTLPKNSILVGCIGNIGKIGMTNDDISAFNQQINAIVCNEYFLPDFIYYLLIHSKPVLEKSAVKTTLPILNKGNFQKLKLKAPKVLEQSKIAYVLSTVQKAIEQQDKLIRHTTELKKALMQKVFTEGTKGEKQKQTEMGLVPESWEVKTIGNKKTLMQYGTSVKCDYEKTGVPVLRIPNVLNGKIDISDLKYGVPKSNEVGKLKLKKGDLIFVRTNGAKELTGRCSIFNNEIENCYYASYLIRVQFNENEINSEYLNYYTQTEKGRSFLSGKANRTADGKYNINTGTLNSVIFPKPLLTEQNEIVNIIRLVENNIAVQKGKKQTLTDLFKTLLHELMTGERRVNEIDFEGIADT